MKTLMLSESEGYDLLRNYGVPVPEYRIVMTPHDAADTAEAIGFPVVMKIISPQIVHKSDAGGVIVGVGSRDAAAAAFDRIITGAKKYRKDAEIQGIIVEQQAEPGLELIIGGKDGPDFWQGHHLRHGRYPCRTDEGYHAPHPPA